MGETLIYSQGQTATITANFVTSPAGMPIDVPDATIQIFGVAAEVILPPTPMVHVMTGFYFYDYVIPNLLPVNVYTVVVSGTVLGVPTQMSVYLQVLPAGAVTPVTFSQRAAELIVALEKYIGCAQQIPVYQEQARNLADRVSFQLTWPRWNLANHIIYKNGNILNDGYTIDLGTGTVKFAAPQHETDFVFASYNFRFFTQMEELGFITDAIDQINIEPPQSRYTIDSFPDQYVGVLMQGAAKNAIKRLLFCLAFQQPATIFGGPDRVKDAISTFQSLKENYEKEFTADKKTTKTKQPYPKMGVVVQPEYTLPGGRCLVARTYMNVKGYGMIDIAEAYRAFESGKRLLVLSDIYGYQGFARVGHVWRSGIKRVFRLETVKGRVVEGSSEHLFFSNGEYRPLMALRSGDHLVASDGVDRVKRVVMTKHFSTMYDIEVPDTSNLFANGIKCHNSRWFRYLFSSNVG